MTAVVKLTTPATSDACCGGPVTRDHVLHVAHVLHMAHMADPEMHASLTTEPPQ